MKSVLLVCTANMCRSPLAEGLLREAARADGDLDDWLIASAGVAAYPGQEPMPESVQVAAERGADIRRHRSEPITADLLDRFSLVLVMEQRHRQMIEGAFPQAAGKVELLTEVAGEQGDVDDPVGKGIQHYQVMADRVSSLLEGGMERIRELAARDAGR